MRPRPFIASAIRAALFVSTLALPALAAEPAPQPAPSKVALDGPRMLLIGLDGSQSTVVITRLELSAKSGSISYVDLAGKPATLPLDDIAALAPAAWGDASLATLPPALPSSDAAWLELADGRRLPGQFAPADADTGASAKDEPIRWVVPTLGEFSAPLDQVLRLYGPGALDRPGINRISAVHDTVIFTNNDRAEGLVESLSTTIRIQPTPAPGSDGKPAPAPEPQVFDASSVALVVLANPRLAPSAPMLYLDDGSAIGLESLIFARGQLRIKALQIEPPTAQAEPPSLPPARVLALVPKPGRLIALSSLPIQSQEPAPERLFSDPAVITPLASRIHPLGATDILLPGPMRVDWTLPTTASRLIGLAQLDDSARDWGDCELVLSIVPRSGPERTLATVQLSDALPAAPINAELGPLRDGDRLRATVRAASLGSIQDRVLLRRFLLVGK